MAAYELHERVEFSQTDAAGIMHFSNYFLMMEKAEHALLRHLGRSVVEDEDGTTRSWPRVSAHCDFRGAARFEELLLLRVTISNIGDTSVTYAFEFRREADDALLAEGRLTSVCCRVEHGKRPVPVPIPSDFREALGRFAEASS